MRTMHTCLAILLGMFAIALGATHVDAATADRDLNGAGELQHIHQQNTIPPAPIVLTGRVTVGEDVPLADASILLDGRLVAQTDANGTYILSDITPGLYSLAVQLNGYTFPNSPRLVSVPSDASVNFVGWPMALPPDPIPPNADGEPVLIVHGIQVMDLEGYRCQQQPQRFNGQSVGLGSNSTLDGDLALWLVQEGYEVWFAHLTTSTLHTPSLAANADCLQQQVEYLHAESGEEIVLIAHSMGGLVSRACLSQNGCSSKIKALYTLGSPHGGVNMALVGKILLKLAETYAKSHGAPIPIVKGVCIWQAALCEMSTESMLEFNFIHSNQRSVDYAFIGGDATPGWNGFLLRATERANDGIVGSRSAVGWTSATSWFIPVYWPEQSFPRQYWTDETHISTWGDAYYESRGGQPSQAFGCLAYELGLKSTWPSTCRIPNTVRSARASQEEALNPTTPSFDGVLAAGESVTHTVFVDTVSTSLFLLATSDTGVGLLLQSPDGQVITPSYADANPQAVNHEQTPASDAFPALLTYTISDTVPGPWQLIVYNGSGVDNAAYTGFVAMESNRTLTLDGADARYSVGETAIFIATLNGVNADAAATVTATIDRPDGADDMLTFTSIGDGLYRAEYSVPNAAGRVLVEVNASGNDGGTVFSRQTEAIFTIVAPKANIAGVAGHREVDENADNLSDQVILNIQIDVREASTYSLFAHVYSGETLAATSGTTVQLEAGMQTLPLTVDANTLRALNADSLSVERLFLLDVEAGDILLNEQQGVYNFSLAGTDEPGEPDDPGDPDDPSEPDNPDEPDNPGDPDGPSEPDEPDNPDDPSDEPEFWNYLPAIQGP